MYLHLTLSAVNKNQMAAEGGRDRSVYHTDLFREHYLVKRRHLERHIKKQ